MMASSSGDECTFSELVHAYALHALSADEAESMQKHLERCERCRKELGSLKALTRSFVAWPTNVLRPDPLWDRLSDRVSTDSQGAPSRDGNDPATVWREPEWREVAPGIDCKLLATDLDRDRVSMLVRLRPGVHYPPHEHAGIEELHLLDGELWIDDRKLRAGDYNKAEPGTRDSRVWSETGCTCVLTTSPSDVLR